MAILGSLCDGPALTIVDLSQVLAMPKMSVCRNVDRLEHAGLIRRSRGVFGDRRQVHLTTTDLGLSAYRSAQIPISGATKS